MDGLDVLVTFGKFFDLAIQSCKLGYAWDTMLFSIVYIIYIPNNIMVIAINWNMLTGSAKNTVANTSPKTADKERIKDDLTTPIRIMLCRYRYRDRANPKTPKVIIGNI